MSATLIPCVRTLPVGWAFGAFETHEDTALFRLQADGGDGGIVDVELRPGCGDPVPGVVTETDEPGTELTQEIASRSPYRATWIYVFEGGCARYRIELGPETVAAEHLPDLEDSLSFLERSELARELEAQGA